MSFHGVLLLSLLLATTTVAIAEICIEGYVMDEYCIDRGTLFDNPSITTLEEPDKHSVHCLVDVPRCVTSGYNVLLLNPLGNPQYGRAVKLDDRGNEKAVELARRVGSCSTCGKGNNLTHGFRATFFGSLSVLGEAPHLLKVRAIATSPRMYDRTAVDDGCPGGATKLNFTLSTQSGTIQRASLAHGSLMLIGWGILLPTGVVAAHFLKHRPNALWFKLHRMLQVSGLVCVVIAWVVALASFNVFNVVDTSFVHGTLGMIVMVLGILQPINAFVRPHPPSAGEARAFKRLLWEIVHKSSGYIAVLLALVTILLGTGLIFNHNNIFRAVWGVSLVWLVTFGLGSMWDGRQYRRRTLEVNAGGNGEL